MNLSLYWLEICGKNFRWIFLVKNFGWRVFYGHFWWKTLMKIFGGLGLSRKVAFGWIHQLARVTQNNNIQQFSYNSYTIDIYIFVVGSSLIKHSLFHLILHSRMRTWRKPASHLVSGNLFYIQISAHTDQTEI